MDATDCLAFPAASHMLNSIRTANENGTSPLIHQPLSTSNSNANSIQADIDLFNEISANTTTLWQTVTKAAATITLEEVNLVKDNLDNDHAQAATIRLNNESMFLPSVDENVNTLLQPQQLQQLRIKLGMFQYFVILFRARAMFSIVCIDIAAFTIIR